MDNTKRQITKIAREVNKFTARMLKLDGIGTEKADQLKNSKASVETLYYEFLEEAFSPQDNAEFCRLLNILYTRSKEESKADFPNLTHRFLEGSREK